MIKLKEVEAPKPEEGLIPVMLSDETMQNRKACLLESMQKDGFDAVVVYADLEHGSNFEYLCGFLPRFEEELLILHANGKAFMVLGNENLNKAGKARIEAVPIHMPHFSLPNQPMQTEKSVAQILASCELEDAEKIGLIGWKNFTSHVEDNHLLFDLPYFLVEALKTVCGKAQFANAAYLLIGENGVRTTNNANEFAHYEYGAALAGNCILKTMDRLKVGKTEMEMAETLAADGSPSRTPSSDASSTAKRPASTVEVRRGGITPLSSSSTGVQVAPVFSLTSRAKGWFQSTTDQGAYVHAGDVLGVFLTI